jgi:branched-chain amino acid transport system permease protein
MDVDTLFHSFWSFTVTGLANGSIYALVALGYTLVYGVLRLINFAHSEVFMIGTLASLFTLRAMGADDYGRVGVTLVVVIIVAFASSAGASAFTAIILERIAYRPLRRRNAPRLAFLISAIGMSLFLQELVAVSLFGHTIIGRVPSGTFVLEKNTLFKFFDANIRIDQIIVIASAVLMMIALDQFVRRTRLGRGVRAVSQDMETAQLMGVNIDRVIMLTFLLGGIMAGGAGLLYLITLERTAFNVGFFIGIKAFTAAVLGGIGNLRGALVGGLLLGLIENYGSAIFGTQWRDPIAFVVLILVLLFRPTGILGEQLGRARA